METSKVKVMILGVDHFGSVGQHLMKHDVEDVLSEEKQKEINELLDKLSKFKPTKIAVEGRKDKDEEYNLEYIKYCLLLIPLKVLIWTLLILFIKYSKSSIASFNFI